MDSRFAAPLERAGYTVTQESKARYLRGMMRASPCFQGGGLEHYRFLRKDFMIRLFMNAALRKGNAYTTKELRQIATPAEAVLEFLNSLHNLVICDLFQRGYRWECNQCALEWWYPLRDLVHEPVCIGCQHPIFLPLELDFAYRLNPLIAVGINNGAITIFLAALALKPLDSKHDFYDFCAVVRKGTLITDIDLLLRRDGRLCLVECKDNLPEETALQDQLAKLATIARDADADAYFATLAENVPESILAFATENKITVLARQALLSHS